MSPVKPMLDGIELTLVQKIDAAEEQVQAQHGVPALEGDFLQGLGRRATRVTLSGVMTGAEAAEDLKTLREKFRAAAPVPFVADIATATKVERVLIEEMGVRELAGKPERFEYALALRELIPPPPQEVLAVQQAEAEEAAPDVDEQIREEAADLGEEQVSEIVADTATIEVQVESEPGADFGGIAIFIERAADDGESFAASSTQQVDGLYRFEGVKAGEYTVRLEIQ